MAELTKLDEKLAEVLGLAQAAQDATDKVERLMEEEEIVGELKRMRDEAAETKSRCTDLADSFDGKKSAILEKAAETKAEAKEMMSTYLGEDAEGLDGLEFLIMAEAGEVGHWEVLGELGNTVGDAKVQELVSWAHPIQDRHLNDVRKFARSVASDEDPAETS